MPSFITSDNGVSSGSAGLKTTAASDGALALQTTTAAGAATTAVTIGTDQSVTFAQAANLPNTFGFKNRLINGGMAIDQRNAGASVTGIYGSVYPVDRWPVYGSVANKLTAQRSSTAPTGFSNSVLITSSAATSFGSTDEYSIWQKIEGFNVADFGWGTASAATVTLSFWVRSSLTGTFGGGATNGAYNRSYVFSYTISAANTWEYKTVTIPGDTTGTWITNNGNGLYLAFDLGSGTSLRAAPGSWGAGYYIAPTGATSVLATNAATFYITGVQLEKGSTATSFDYRPYGTELALCQRYYETSYAAGTKVGTAAANNNVNCGVGSTTYAGTAAGSSSQTLSSYPFKVTKRAAPTTTIYSYTSATTGVVSNAWTGADYTSNSGSLNSSTTNDFSLYNGSSANITVAAYAVTFHFAASAEL